MQPYKKSEAKEWAREEFRGLEATILPSFTADCTELDEQAIRHDVRELIRHGFFSIVLVNETGTTTEEDKRFAEWVVDEARGRIGVCSSLRYPRFEDNLEMAAFAEHVGCNCVLISYPPNFRATSAGQVVEYTRRICDATNLAVELFPSQKYNFGFPGGCSPQLLNEMADLENVAAMKLAVIEYAWMDQCFRLFGHKASLAHPFDESWPIFIQHYGMQWSGSAPWQIFQTPDDPRQVRLFNLMQGGRMDEAMELYWKMDPLRKYFMYSMQSQIAVSGLYNYQQWKYMEGLVGMSGGEMRFPRLQFKAQDMAKARQAALASGLKIVSD